MARVSMVFSTRTIGAASRMTANGRPRQFSAAEPVMGVELDCLRRELFAQTTERRELLLRACFRQGEVVKLEERQLVPVAALEHNFPINNVKEPASAQAERIAPFENAPFAIFKDVFRNAHHFGGPEGVLEHCSNSVSSCDGQLRH